MASSPLAPDATAGRVAVVTGGGTGIGRATAHALAGSGASVLICGRRPEPLARVAGEIAAAGGACATLALDVREDDAADRIVDAALERFGALDVLVNNAGGQFAAPAETISDNGWRAVARLNVDAVWRLTRTAATRAMIPARRGLVVFVGLSPLRGMPGFAHAIAARAASGSLASEPRARVEPVRHPQRLHRARLDPDRGARQLRPRRQSPSGSAASRSGGSGGRRRSGR